MPSQFEKYLTNDENILWQGQPNKYFFSINFIISNTILSLIALLFFIFWNLIVYSTNTPTLFKLVGVLFLIGAFSNLFLVYFFHIFRRSKTYYAITEQRIFVEYWFLGRRIKSFQIKSLPEPIFRNHSNYISTILINYEKPWAFRIFTRFIEYSWRDQFRRLEYISNAPKVFELLMERRNSSKY